MFGKKKSIFGLEGEFREVKNAGFTATKKVKRDKSVNRRAGLHDKIKYLQGEARVKRCKPLALKHVHRLRKFAAVGAVGVVGVVAAFSVGFFTPADNQPLADVGNPTACYEPPTDGTTPVDHTLVENVGYLNYVLQQQAYWSSETKSSVTAMMGIEQGVDSYKQYYNGILIAADCSFSSLSESMQYGEQFCQAYGVVLSRHSTSNKTDDLKKGMDSPWTTDPANGWTVPNYRENRGLPPLDFSVYILDENTIANATDYTVTDNGNGTYSMTLQLNVNTEDKETAADYYYRLQMRYNGNLNELPVISKTTLTYTFDANWRVLELVVEDAYRAKAMGINSNCTSRCVTTYSYDEESAYNTFWEDYFKAEYERLKDTLTDDAVSDKEEAPSAMGYLGSAFASVMTEGAVFKLDLNIDNLDLNGVVCVEMEDGGLGGLTAKLGDILVWLDGGYLYIDLVNAQYKLDINSLSSGTEGSALDGFDLEGLMSGLTSGEFVVNEETGIATLNSTLSLFGLDIEIYAQFEKTESGIALNYLDAKIPVGGKVVKARLCFGEESDKPAKPNDTTGYTDILTDGVTLDISLKANDLVLDGIAKIIMQNGEFAGVYATLGDLGVYYDCPHNMLYLSAGDTKYKLDVSKLGSGDIDVSGILGLINIDKLIENLTTGENTLGTSLDINVFETILKAAIGVNLDGGIKVDANLKIENLDATLTVAPTNKEAKLPNDLDAYADVLNGNITLDVSLTLLTGLADNDGNRNEVKIEGKVALCLSNGNITEIRADFGSFAVYYEFEPNVVYIKIGETKAKIAVGEMDIGALSSISVLTAEDGVAVGLPAVVSDLLQNIVASGKIISSNADLSVLGSVIPIRADINIDGGISVNAGLSLFGIDAEVGVSISDQPLEGLGEEEKTEYVDVLENGWNLVDGLLTEHLSANVEGTVYSYTDEYAEQDNVKYSFNATLDYDKGHTVNEEGETVPNGFPIHIDKGTLDEDGNRTGVNFYIDSTLYLHFNLELEASKPTEDSLYLDLWLFDANPATDDKGITTTAELAQDGELDVYVKISKYKEAGKAYPVYDKNGNKKLDENNKEITVKGEPLCLYAPVSEIMTLVSIAGAAADLHGLTFENSAELTKLASDIADIVDQLLINNYLAYTHDQFSSLGNSLIPQILGMSLSDLLNGLIGSAEDVVEEASGFSLDFSKKYVKSLTYGDNTLALTLNSTELFGEEITDDLLITLEKAPVNGKDFLSSISLNNLYTDNNSQKLDLGLNLSYGEITRPAQMDGFRNADGLDTLVQALVNSATHKVAGGDGKTYDLNHYYLLQGDVTANINAIGFINIDAKIQIKSVAVYIDEETNDVSLDVHIYYDGVAAAGQVAIDGDADVYLSMQLGSNQDNERIIIRRVRYSYYETGFLSASEKTYATPVVEVRSMTLKEFSDNLMDNITFIFNFGSVITDNIAKSDQSSNSGVSFDGCDYGTYASKILAYYVSEETLSGASWTVAINGGLLTDLIGMTMSDIPVKFNAVKGEDGAYTVNSLEILKSKMELFGNVVKLEVWGSFTYCNPHEEMGTGYVDSSKDLFNMNVQVNSACDLKYIGNSFTWACGSYVKLPVGVVSTQNGQSYMLDGYTVGTQPVQFENIVEENGVRYGLTRLIDDTVYTAVWSKAYTVTFTDEYGNKLYSVTYRVNDVLNFGNMPACPELDGYTSQWVSEDGTPANGIAVTENMSFKVEYEKTPLKVTLNSTVDFSYTGYDGSYKLLNVGFEEGADYTVLDATAAGYNFLGWWYNDGGNWRKITSVEEFAGQTSVTLEALWLKADISGAGYRKSYKVAIVWTKYSYTHVGTVKYELYGNSELLDSINGVTTNSYVHGYYDGGSYTKDFAAKDGNGTQYKDYEIEFNTDGYNTDTGNDKNRPTVWYIVAEFTVDVNGTKVDCTERGETCGYTDI